MLKNLYIKNFAIIDEANISFDKGFTVITGETGAGKSILMGALSLVMGERADNKYIQASKDKCIVEAQFDIKENKNAIDFLLENDFEKEEILIIRRELNANGKSRVFVNDTPATLNVLSSLCEFLLDLHRQFDTIELQHHQHQLHILDSILSHQDNLSLYESVFSDWKKTEKEYEQLLQRNKQVHQELDYNKFIFQELEALQLKENEIENMEQELAVLENAEAFKQDTQAAMHILNDSDTPLISTLKQVIQLLETHAKINQNLQPILERLYACHVELKDIHAEIESEGDKVFYDAEKVLLLNERINEANRLLKKHHLNTTAEILQLKDEIEKKILNAQSADDDEKMLFEKTKSLHTQVTKQANEISENRKKNIGDIEKKVNKLLHHVGMPNAAFRISITDAELSKTGMDKVEFLFDANKTGTFKPLAKVASGGELSRIMLCIKSIVAGNTNLPTLIFDEIDTGISGETAIQVGNIMKQLSAAHQLISITHLPQIAGKANQHLYIYKNENEQGKISTHIKKLKDEERVDVLAEMLGGKNSTAQSREMVRELMR